LRPTHSGFSPRIVTRRIRRRSSALKSVRAQRASIVPHQDVADAPDVLLEMAVSLRPWRNAHTVGHCVWRLGAKEPDYRHRRLLRTAPSAAMTAAPPSNVISARASRVGGILSVAAPRRYNAPSRQTRRRNIVTVRRT
jgi:hypothetical protein